MFVQLFTLKRPKNRTKIYVAPVCLRLSVNIIDERDGLEEGQLLGASACFGGVRTGARRWFAASQRRGKMIMTPQYSARLLVWSVRPLFDSVFVNKRL